MVGLGSVRRAGVRKGCSQNGRRTLEFGIAESLSPHMGGLERLYRTLLWTRTKNEYG